MPSNLAQTISPFHHFRGEMPEMSEMSEMLK
jgi:hypothetical protein